MTSASPQSSGPKQSRLGPWRKSSLAKARREGAKAVVVAGIAASAFQAHAEGYDFDLFSDLSTLDYEADAKRANIGSRVKQQDPFAAFRNVPKEAPPPAAAPEEPEAVPEKAPKPALKRAAPKERVALPPAEEKAEPAPPAPIVAPPPKKAEAPPPPKAEPPKEDSVDIFAALREAAETKVPAPEVKAPEVKTPEVKAPETNAKPPAAKEPEADDPFAAFFKEAPAPAPEKPAPKPAPEAAPKPRARPKPAPKADTPPKEQTSTGGGFPLLAGLLATVTAAGAGGFAYLLRRSTPAKRALVKRAILEALEGTDRGYNVSDAQLEEIERVVQVLEKQNPTPKPQDSVLIDGRWVVLFTAAPLLLGKKGDKAESTVETVDMDSGTIRVDRVVKPLPFFQYTQSTTAVLDVTDSKSAVVMQSTPSVIKSMKQAQTARGSLRGSVRQATEAGATLPLSQLSTTYLDEAWRISRTAEGDLTIYRREGATGDAVEAKEGEEEEEPLARPPPPPRKPRSTRSTRTPPPPRQVTLDEEDEDAPVKAKAPVSLPKFSVPKLDAKAPLSLPKFPAPKAKSTPALPPPAEEPTPPPAPVVPATPPMELPKLPQMPQMPSNLQAELSAFMPQLSSQLATLKERARAVIAEPGEGARAAQAKAKAPEQGEEEERPPVPDAGPFKERLLDLLQTTERGLKVTQEEADEIEQAIKDVEACNTERRPLASPLLSGKWELLYTTSESVIGKGKAPPLQPKGPIYQYIDTAAMRACNEQTLRPLGNLANVSIPASVSAALTAETDTRLGVKFDTYAVGPLSFGADGDANAKLEVTYLDEEFRVSRGSKGNVFVLRMADRSVTQPPSAK